MEKENNVNVSRWNGFYDKVEVDVLTDTLPKKYQFSAFKCPYRISDQWSPAKGRDAELEKVR